MISICMTYFRSLTLANLDAALYSVKRQDLSFVREIVLVDNNTDDALENIQAVVRGQGLEVPVRIMCYKHGDSLKTHSWSTNVAVRETQTPWVLFTRADYLLDFGLLDKFVQVALSESGDRNRFITSNGCHLGYDIAACENLGWRESGPQSLSGTVFDYTCIDAGVWMSSRVAFDCVNGLDEDLSAWGHAQTHFQWKLHKAGVEFVRVPEVLFYHPLHAATRNLELGHQQLRDRGIDLKEMWQRYEGYQVY